MEKEAENGEMRNLVLGRYEMGRILGRGTFAKVYHGRDLRNGESVAIKVIHKDQISRQAGMMEQIKREISVMRLVRHPNVVELREVMATRSRIFFVMEYVRGGELFARVLRGPLPEEKARRCFRQLICAVEFCHSLGVSHRDLKPENLLLDNNGNLKVADFGLSALPEQRRHDGLLHTQCGTPTYVAPEVLRRHGYDGSKADVWSCGVILYVLLASFLPFQEENLMQMYCKVLKADYRIPPWFSGDARRLISLLLVANPEKRISIPAIKSHPWFKKEAFLQEPRIPPPPTPVEEDDELKPGSPKFYNAFKLISTFSSGFNLSSLFQNRRPAGTMFTSRSPTAAIVERLERAGQELGFNVCMVKPYKVKMEKKSGNEWKGQLELVVMAEVFEAADGMAVVEFSKDSGEASEFAKFCEEKVRKRLKDIVWAWQGATGTDGGEQ
ncbi:CBL-interacting protein kinase 16-like [Curcuma longa]|uniref:CBL-interacting protein kinase 16-like n=1 Tax=Curcuma longa TaxID=136217 RepID=UPI003D9FA65B